MNRSTRPPDIRLARARNLIEEIIVNFHRKPEFRSSFISVSSVSGSTALRLHHAARTSDNPTRSGRSEEGRSEEGDRDSPKREIIHVARETTRLRFAARLRALPYERAIVRSLSAP